MQHSTDHKKGRAIILIGAGAWCLSLGGCGLLVAAGAGAGAGYVAAEETDGDGEDAFGNEEAE